MMLRLVSISDTYDHYNLCCTAPQPNQEETIQSYFDQNDLPLPRKRPDYVFDYFTRRLYDYRDLDRKAEPFASDVRHFKYNMGVGHVASELRKTNPGIFFFLPRVWISEYESNKLSTLSSQNGVGFVLTIYLSRFHSLRQKIPDVYRSIIAASPDLAELLRNVEANVMRPLMANDKPPTLLLQNVNPITHAGPLSLTELFSPIDQVTVQVRGGRHASRSGTDIVYDSQ